MSNTTSVRVTTAGITALLLVGLLTSAAYSADAPPTTLIHKETPPQDAQLAHDPEDHTSADPIHPWDGNDLTDSLNSPGNVRHRPKSIPTGPQRVSDKRELTKVSGGGLQPEHIGFVRNLPNPFNAQTRIEFALEQAGPATLEVYNLLGQIQARVVWSQLEAGTHSWLWHGQSTDGRPAASGVYFYRLEVRDASAIGRMVLLK